MLSSVFISKDGHLEHQNQRCQNLKEYRMAVEELLKHYPEIPNGAFGKLDEEGR